MNEKVEIWVYNKHRKFYNFATRTIQTTKWGDKLAIKDYLIYDLGRLTPLNHE